MALGNGARPAPASTAWTPVVVIALAMGAGAAKAAPSACAGQVPPAAIKRAPTEAPGRRRLSKTRRVPGPSERRAVITIIIPPSGPARVAAPP